MKPKLSILIATQGRRNASFRRLIKELLYQVKPYGGMIEIIAYWNNGELPIGTIRQALIEEATGEYICFIDDDDFVPSYYCKEILQALGKDYVGFEVRLFNEGIENLPVYHSLQHQVWTQDEAGFYRGVTHLNPLKREIALQGSFSIEGAGEDADWAHSILHLVKNENYISKVMYYYYHDMRDTSFGGDWVYRESGYRRPPVVNRYFRYHPKSKLGSREVEEYANNS